MHPVEVRLTRELIEKIDDFVLKGIYPNRSEAIRLYIRDGLIKENTVGLGDSKELNVILARTAIAQEELGINRRASR